MKRRFGQRVFPLLGCGRSMHLGALRLAKPIYSLHREPIMGARNFFGGSRIRSGR